MIFISLQMRRISKKALDVTSERALQAVRALMGSRHRWDARDLI